MCLYDSPIKSGGNKHLTVTRESFALTTPRSGGLSNFSRAQIDVPHRRSTLNLATPTHNPNNQNFPDQWNIWQQETQLENIPKLPDSTLNLATHQMHANTPLILILNKKLIHENHAQNKSNNPKRDKSERWFIIKEQAVQLNLIDQYSLNNIQQRRKVYNQT